MAVDIQKLFNQDLPAALKKNADDAMALGAKFQMNITGPNGGQWNVVANSSGPSCKPGTGPADCTITMSDEDFHEFMESPSANGIHLVFQGRLKVGGNPMLAQKLPRLFALK